MTYTNLLNRVKMLIEGNATIPVMATDRHIRRKDQAVLARRLFKGLGVVGLSITTPAYSMAQHVDIRLPEEDATHPHDLDRRPHDHRRDADVPDYCRTCEARNECVRSIEAILDKAFPNHVDRSDSQSDYFDSCWSVSA